MHESRVTSIGADVRTSESAPEPVAAVFLHVHVAKVHTVHRRRERLLHFYNNGRQSIGVQVNRDGLLCVDGDSRETDRNQADVTVRKVCGADVERLKHGLVTHARIKCDPLREDLISSNYVLMTTFDLDLQRYAKH
ncbi:hypothetical protein G5I_14019 [Acromyrmex echinatior]|uniref:Uncharacterized protein n=1 Tax=Acromyrmex echinatior TaxID=103372 RepID=F4X6Q1_ACREC|nr:hypothetical protein G5I_14019 [Acromyrmex echinatior]